MFFLQISQLPQKKEKCSQILLKYFWQITYLHRNEHKCSLAYFRVLDEQLEKLREIERDYAYPKKLIR
jgi:hypothetical protein